MTAVDGTEVGRLDRILAGHRASIAAQDAAAMPYQRQALAAALAYAEERTPAEVVRLRAMVVALEAECAALTDALGDPNVTHPFAPMHRVSVICGAERDEDSYCALPSTAAVHRTPARVRAELGEAPCAGSDPACPCQDGDTCHYRDSPITGTKAMVRAELDAP